MKKIIILFSVALFLQSCQGTDDDNTATLAAEQALVQKKQAIKDYISTFSCAAVNGCSSIAFGDKPCGGPREYLVFSNAVNLVTLQNMVLEYNLLDKQNNIRKNAVSDCMYVGPPANIGCVNGICNIIN
jgi:hypothetical protein